MFRDNAGAMDAIQLEFETTLEAAARCLTLPTLLVRGRASELVHETHAKAFLALVPHAQYADVRGARHMVAGDQNDQFAAEILKFLHGLEGDRRGFHVAVNDLPQG